MFEHTFTIRVYIMKQEDSVLMLCSRIYEMIPMDLFKIYSSMRDGGKGAIKRGFEELLILGSLMLLHRLPLSYDDEVSKLVLMQK